MNVIEISDLDFRYPRGRRPALEHFSFSVEEGRRVLLVGRNGAGKSTLLHLLAGRHLIAEDRVRVLGRPAFHDTSLVEDVTFLGGPFRFDVDIPVADILERAPGVEVGRRDRLLEVLGVDPGWHMHRISDGQRRRVQILLGLLRPSRLLLLDEITTDLDLIARLDLLELLRKESVERGATIVYATHIFDALEDWGTDVAFLEAGRLERHVRLAALPRPLYRVVEGWLREAAR
jgi:CCR4-NOT complex subunit CAF16